MSDRSIQEAVQKLAGTHLKDEIHIIAATVIDVDQAERTCSCSPIGGKAVTDLANVQLMPEVDDGWLLIPAIGSTVIIQWSTRNVPHIIMWSALEKAFLVTLNGIQLQGGELGGLPVSRDLVTKFNNIETAFNQLNAKVNGLAPTPVIPPLVETVVKDIANDSITQGA